MEFVELKCPSCGADLKVENGLDIFYCQYCGTKIVLNGQSDIVVEAKKEIKLAETQAEKELVMQKEIHRQEMEKKMYDDQQFYKVMKAFVIAIAIGFLILIVTTLFAGNEW